MGDAELSWSAKPVRQAQASRGDYPRFHLAFPVSDLTAARRFYIGVLGCTEGRSAQEWVDFDFFGHQIVAFRVGAADMKVATSLVDGDQVPVRHFGVILEVDEWNSLADRLETAGVRFIIEPHVRFKGQIGEQSTMFLLDPFDNALEFKAFENIDQLFAPQ